MAQIPQKPCDICEQSPGKYLCLECIQLFCDTCKIFHTKQKLSKNHEFQLASEPIPEARSKCSDHKETFNLFCITCDVPVCTKCITGKHQGHKISDIQETVQGIKQKLDKELKPKVEDFDKRTKHVIKEIKRVENESLSVIQSVKEEANRLKAIIDRHTDQLILSVKSDVDKEKSRLQKKLDNINTTMASLRSLDDQRRTLDKNRPDGNLIGELKSLLDSIEKLNINPLSDAVSVKYIPPTETFQVEDVMGKYQINGAKQNHDTERRRSSHPFLRFDSHEEKIGRRPRKFKEARGIHVFTRPGYNSSQIEVTTPFGTGHEDMPLSEETEVVEDDFLPSKKPMPVPNQLVTKNPEFFSNIRPIRFVLDAETAHKEVSVSADGKTFTNYKKSALPDASMAHTNRYGFHCRHRKFKGARGTHVFTMPGIYFYEVILELKVVSPLQENNVAFEIGIARRSSIDNKKFIEGQPFAWSMIGAHHPSCDSVCIHVVRDRKVLLHKNLVKNEVYSVCRFAFGFLLNTNEGTWDIFNSKDGQKCCRITEVNCDEPLLPVVSGYNASQIEVMATFVTGHESIPLKE